MISSYKVEFIRVMNIFYPEAIGPIMGYEVII